MKFCGVRISFAPLPLRKELLQKQIEKFYANTTKLKGKVCFHFNIYCTNKKVVNMFQGRSQESFWTQIFHFLLQEDVSQNIFQFFFYYRQDIFELEVDSLCLVQQRGSRELTTPRCVNLCGIFRHPGACASPWVLPTPIWHIQIFMKKRK